MTTNEIQESVTKRPYLLSVMCVALFVYSATITLIFGIAILYKSWITIVVTDYFSGFEFSTRNIMFLSLAGLITHISLLFSAILLWRLKRLGYFFLILTLATLILLPYLVGFGNRLSAIVYVILIGLFSIYYRRYS